MTKNKPLLERAYVSIGEPYINRPDVVEAVRELRVFCDTQKENFYQLYEDAKAKGDVRDSKDFLATLNAYFHIKKKIFELFGEVDS